MQEFNPEEVRFETHCNWLAALASRGQEHQADNRGNCP